MRMVAAGLSTLLWASAAPAFAQQASLQNPLRFPTIEQFIEGTLRAVILIGIPVIVVFTVYAGFKFIMARGNSAAISKARENFVYVIIGMVMILGAWVLATLLGSTVTQLLGGTGGGTGGSIR